MELKYYTTKYRNEHGNTWWVVWEKAKGWDDGVAIVEAPSRPEANAHLNWLRSQRR